MMIATISSKETQKILYREEFEQMAEAINWFSYQVPSANLKALRPNTKLEVDGVYVLMLSQSIDLPFVDAGFDEVDAGDRSEPLLTGEKVELAGGEAEGDIEPDLPDLAALNAEDSIAAIRQIEDPEILAMLIDVESAGKNRVSVLKALNEQLGV